MKRKMYASESLYPSACEECEKMFEEFNAKLDRALGENKLPVLAPHAVIVPHEGYLFSGYTANFAYRMLKESAKEKKRVIVIGASGKEQFQGVSGSFYKSFKTPCGKLKVDIEYLDRLRNSCGVSFEEKAHQEESTEVQMPFIKHYLKKLKVIELVYGDVSRGELERVIEVCLADKDNIVVICTDLGDLEVQKALGVIDATYLNAISMLDTQKLQEGCNASGILALKALIQSAKKADLKAQILNYQTSSIETDSGVKVQGHLSVALH